MGIDPWPARSARAYGRDVAERAVARRSWMGPGLSAGGLVAAIALGSWWTGQAVADGRMGVMLVRFTLSVAGGLYYLAMYRVATGRRLRAR